jgi:hypothetical protein
MSHKEYSNAVSTTVCACHLRVLRSTGVLSGAGAQVVGLSPSVGFAGRLLALSVSPCVLLSVVSFVPVHIRWRRLLLSWFAAESAALPFLAHVRFRG